MSDDVIKAFSRLNDLLGSYVPENKRTDQADRDWHLVYEAVKQAARQAPASGEVEPVCLVRKNDSRQVYLCNPDGTAFQPYNYIGVDFYTHPPAKVPEGITGEMLNKVWKAGFDAENIDDREYCQELIILRNAVEDATPAPATPPQER